MRLRISLGFKSVLNFAVLASSVWALTACSEAADTGEPVPIPSVRLLCNSNDFADCSSTQRPDTVVVFTKSGCQDPRFGQTIAFRTLNGFACTSAGCNYTIPTTEWTDANGPVATIPSGTYSVCGCLTFGPSSGDFVNCDAEGELSTVSIGQNTGQISVTNWN